ncbi:hypothetical protein SAMN02745146_1488 [Hymenobacter daecheongensis DSM 21074]|uniref:DUF5683 domain-containing protein n=1 Tax=Hymenobacter daecheongensis DSM 21074 TaxID=1121955 RepID=A0A1M6DFS5_9BACT|nr:hypothetical protein SAMN02745146_1488 [Hymenobacter daecheongensis DSM 21074]
MRRCFVFLLPLLLAFGAAHSQQAPAKPLIQLSPEDEDRRESGPQKNFYFTTRPAPNAKYENAGFFGQRLRPYLAGNTEAIASLNRYRRQKWLFLTERVLFVSTVGVYSQQVLAGSGEQQYFNNTQKIAIGVAAFSLLSNAFISRHTNDHFQRAVGEYNAGLSSAHVGGLRRLAPSAIGLTAAAGGQPLLALRWSLR